MGMVWVSRKFFCMGLQADGSMVLFTSFLSRLVLAVCRMKIGAENWKLIE